MSQELLGRGLKRRKCSSKEIYYWKQPDEVWVSISGLSNKSTNWISNEPTKKNTQNKTEFRKIEKQEPLNLVLS